MKKIAKTILWGLLAFALLSEGYAWAQLTQAIAAVSQPEQDGFLGTAWTLVMDLSALSVTYYSRRHFDKPFQFEFERDILMTQIPRH